MNGAGVRDLSRPVWLATVVGALLTTACATTRLDAQWSDPQVARRLGGGTKVWVECLAADLTIGRLCGERFAQALRAKGLVPQVAEPPADAPPPSDAAVLDGARASGAATVLRATLAPEVVAATPGPSIGFGVGGGSWGGGWGGSGVGVGMGFPIGGGSVETGYAATGALTDVGSGRPIWSARATSPPSADLGQQVQALGPGADGLDGEGGPVLKAAHGRCRSGKNVLPDGLSMAVTAGAGPPSAALLAVDAVLALAAIGIALWLRPWRCVGAEGPPWAWVAA